MAGYGEKIFGLRDVKLTTIDGVSQVDLPSSQTFGFQPVLITGELRGDDSLVALVSQVESAEWSLEAGGISLEAWAIMTGVTPVEAGVTPNRSLTYNIEAGHAYPYFKVYGKAIGEDTTDDIHVLLYKVKLTSPLEGSFQDGEFYVTSASGKAVTDGVNGIGDIVQNETAADLPSS